MTNVNQKQSFFSETVVGLVNLTDADLGMTIGGRDPVVRAVRTQTSATTYIDNNSNGSMDAGDMVASNISCVG